LTQSPAIPTLPGARAQAEARFIALMAELFQLAEAQALDFGLYRVIRRHNREVRAFLGEIVTGPDGPRLQGGRLSALLDQAFAAAGDEAEAGERQRLADLEEELGLKPGMTRTEREDALTRAEAVPAVKGLVRDYRAGLDALAGRQTLETDRAEVLNRLYQFFSRHYQDGDFIVERRYGRDGARYIRSTGEDTEFHWATEDMYYIKSGDSFTDYPVCLSGGQRLCFTVEPETLQATRAALKPSDRAHYELDSATKQDGVISVRLRYLKGAQSEKQKDEIVAAVLKAGAVGGPGTSVEIRRWLACFIARNQSDFFIHKRLGEALSEDLDIFIKTQVVDLDQLLAVGPGQTDLPRRALKVACILRALGGEIIAFLAALEGFQKALWEKKKLVLETRYVITLDRLERYAPQWLADHIDAIVAGQRQEWRSLGLGDYPDAACLRASTRSQGDSGQAVLDLPSPACGRGAGGEGNSIVRG
jgi:adenine-specific DNA-methyltransferase